MRMRGMRARMRMGVWHMMRMGEEDEDEARDATH